MLGRAVALSLIALSAPAAAEPGVCHVVDVQLQPDARIDLRPGHTMPPQIVVWVEDAQGTYIDTVFITQATGTYGIGNRPGEVGINSGPEWPYGRRTTTFPVWATKKPARFDTVVFQGGNELQMAGPFAQSSLEPHYCRPRMETEPSYDAITCASPQVYTDKGTLDAAAQSKYPPRQDIVRTSTDVDTVDSYDAMNPYDAISHATPAIRELATIGWRLPIGLSAGEYVMFVEASTEFDHNAVYSVAARPTPVMPYPEYGEPYRGQPSVVFRVPFTIANDTRMTQTATYAGYGDPDGNDGVLRAPDPTITTDVPGSGQGRLALVTDADGTFRVRVRARAELDLVVPNAPSSLELATISETDALFSFLAPGDDAVAGVVRSYEVRYRVGDMPFTAANFNAPDAIVVPPSIVPVAAGEQQALMLDGLLRETHYTVGIRAIDDCDNMGQVASISFVTTGSESGEIDACFIATAAYGSPLAAEVAGLRDVRDRVLRTTILGELFVETYYTFSPPVAGVVGQSELLRATARTALAPIVSFARRW